MHFGGITLLITLALSQVFTGTAAYAGLAEEDGERARVLMAKKLKTLDQNVNMRVQQYNDAGSQDTNAGDGNPFSGNLTNHVDVVEYCRQWIGPRSCGDLMPAYVSIHGAGSDKSPSEALAYQAYEASKTSGGGNVSQGFESYYMWEVRGIKGSPILDAQGKLERKNAIDWRLKQDVREKFEKLGSDTAVQVMNTTLDKPPGSAGETGKRLVAPEALREQAGRATLQLYNRLANSLGAIRTAQPGIETPLNGEDRPDCEAYRAALQVNPDRFGLEEKMDTQLNLDPQTPRGKTIEDRIALCERIRNMPLQTVNPQVVDGEVKATSADTAWVDEWRTRASLYTLSRLGNNPNSVDLPQGVEIPKEEYTQKIAQYKDGGQEYDVVGMTNQEQADGYNGTLDQAAEAYTRMTARGAAPDRAKEILKWKITDISVVKLNGLTPEQYDYVGPNYSRQLNSANNPEENLPETPSKVVVRSR